MKLSHIEKAALMVKSSKELDQQIIALDKMAIAVIDTDQLIKLQFSYELPKDQQKKQPIVSEDGSLIKPNNTSTSPAEQGYDFHKRMIYVFMNSYVQSMQDNPAQSISISILEQLSVETILGVIGVIISDKKARIDLLKKEIIKLGFEIKN